MMMIMMMMMMIQLDNNNTLWQRGEVVSTADVVLHSLSSV